MSVLVGIISLSMVGDSRKSTCHEIDDGLLKEVSVMRLSIGLGYVCGSDI